VATKPHTTYGTAAKSAGLGSREAKDIVYRELLNPHHATTYTPARFWVGLFFAAIFVPVVGGLFPVLGTMAGYGLEQISTAGWPKWLAGLWPVARPVIDGLLWVHLIVLFITVFSMFAVWMERKQSAHMQCRTGPMEVGYLDPTIFAFGKRWRVLAPFVGLWRKLFPKASPHGWLQTLADGLKLMAKEDLIPRGADVALFVLAPIIAFLGVFAAYAALPFHGAHFGIAADLDTAVYFIAAISSIEAIGVVMAGWGSNNKWSLLGGIRAATQMVSYELPLGISVLTAIVVAGTLSITEIVDLQYGTWLLGWNVFKSPFLCIAFVVFFVASLAECKRAPFDLPEAESELVSGYHTEYSSMRFSIFFLAEYAAMYVVAAFGVCLFLGGWYTGIGPLDAGMHQFQDFMWNQQGADPRWAIALAKGEVTTGQALSAYGFWNVVGVAALGSFVLIGKTMVLVFFQMAARWTYPRLRLDQIMYFCLKVLLPISLVALVGATVWELLSQGNVFFGLLGGHTHQHWHQAAAAAGAGG